MIEHRQIPGLEDYEVGDDGSVWSLKFGKRKKLKPQKCPNGYYNVGLYKNGKHHTKFVAPLVLRTFVGPKPPGCQTAHKDGNRANNQLSNLRWATKPENEADKVRHGTTPRGEHNWRSVLNETQVREIKTAQPKRGVCVELARKHGVSWGTISQIRRGLSWKHVDAEA